MRFPCTLVIVSKARVIRSSPRLNRRSIRMIAELEKILGFIKPCTTELLGTLRANLVTPVRNISSNPSNDYLVEPFL